MNDAEIQLCVQKYTPYFYFHQDELYMPSTVESYLQVAILKTTTSGIAPAGPPVGQSLMATADANAYLELSDSAGDITKGNVSTARIYVNVIGSAAPVFYEIQYWVFFPFNGAATGRFDGTAGFSIDADLTPLGQHYGDWERIAVRIDAKGVPFAVFFSQHSRGQWYGSNSKDNPGFQQDSVGQIIVYVAKNTHAFYPVPGDYAVPGSKVDIKITEFTLRDITALDTNHAKSWDTSTAYQIVNIQAAGLTKVASPPTWLSYTRSWGPDESQGLTVASALKVIGGVIIANPVLAVALLPVTAIAAPIATIVLSIIDIWDQDGPASPPWTNGIDDLEGTVVIANWYAAEKEQDLLLGANDTNGLVLIPRQSSGPAGNQKWKLTRVSADGITGLTYTLTCVSGNTPALAPAVDKQISVPYVAPATLDTTAYWTLWPAGVGSNQQLWSIRAYGTSNVMDAAHGGTSSGTPVILHGWKDGDNQRWVITKISS